MLDMVELFIFAFPPAVTSGFVPDDDNEVEGYERDGEDDSTVRRGSRLETLGFVHAVHIYVSHGPIHLQRSSRQCLAHFGSGPASSSRTHSEAWRHFEHLSASFVLAKLLQ